MLLLPHGYEGQGPEHSTARLERFLPLCAEDNIQVSNLTTPAQFFHVLRRQVLRPYRKPLVVMSPKSLLRLPAALSEPEEFTDGAFRSSSRQARTRSGDAGHGLFRKGVLRPRGPGHPDEAVARLKQFTRGRRRSCPRCSAASPVPRWVWAQEESQNMGGWVFVEPLFEALPRRGARQMQPPSVRRPQASASPAMG